MPTLKEYFAPDAEQAVNVRAGEAGQEAMVRAGRMTEEHARASGAIIAQGAGEIGQGVREVGETATKIADDWTYSHDVVKQDAALANLQATKLQQYNEASKTWDPNDINAPRKWMDENWAPSQDQYQAGFTNRRAAERGEAMWHGATEHMNNVVTADTADRAGAAQLLNLHKLGQGVENMASADASSTPRAHAQIDAAIQAAKDAPGVDARHSAAYDEWGMQAHKAVDTASLEGMLVSNPAGAEKLASSGFWKYLPAGQMGQAIQTSKRLHAEDAERGMVLQELADRHASENNYRGWFKDNMTIGPGGILVPGPNAAKDFLSRVGGMLPAQQDAGLSVIRAGRDAIEHETDRAAEGKDLVTDRPTRDNFISHMTDPVTSKDFPTQLSIYKAHAAGKLDGPDTNWLLRMSDAAEHDPQVAAGLRAVSEDNPLIKTELDKARQTMIGLVPRNQGPSGDYGLNPAVAAKIDDFKADTFRTLQLAVLNHQDITPYLDPTNKLYVFSQARIQQYTPTADELQNRLVAGPKAAPAAAPPKEDLGHILSKFLNFSPPPPGGQ